jgi:hypothetical protein
VRSGQWSCSSSLLLVGKVLKGSQNSCCSSIRWMLCGIEEPTYRTVLYVQVRVYVRASGFGVIEGINQSIIFKINQSISQSINHGSLIALIEGQTRALL